MKLLTTGNTKTLKGEDKGYMTFILHLAPSTLSGYNVCPMASKGCKAACLNTAGRGRFKNIQEARIRKTKWFFEKRRDFMLQLVKDIESAIRHAEARDMIPVFRLNGTSDIRWENIKCERETKEYRNVMEAFPKYQFYDYTKLPNRQNIPDNYDLTFSLSESNLNNAITAARDGVNVAVVFEDENFPEYLKLSNKHNGNDSGRRRVVSGDEHDLRFLDPKGVFVGLKAKGKAKKDNSNFVLKTNEK